MDEDMKQIRFTIPGQPFGKQRPKFSRAGAYVKTYTPKETTSYENLVKLFYNEAAKGKMFPEGAMLDVRIIASYGYNETTEGNYEDNSAETFAPVSSEVPTSTPQTGPISVNVAVSPNFQIEAKEGQSEEDIVAVIRRHLGEIADVLGGNIADKLSEVFANMPVSSTKGA